MEEQFNLKKGIVSSMISKEIFEKETELCKRLSKENDGKCCWGSCDNY